MKQVAVVMTLILSQGPFPPVQKIAALLIWSSISEMDWIHAWNSNIQKQVL